MMELDDGLGVPKSIRSETKKKFDELLKDALKKTSTVHEPETSNTDIENSNFILHKFLSDSHKVEGYDFKKSPAEVSIERKPPVPKPRKSKIINENKKDGTSSQASDKTFDVTSPKILKNTEIENEYSSSNSSNKRTYNIDVVNKVKEVGEVSTDTKGVGNNITILSSSKNSSNNTNESNNRPYSSITKENVENKNVDKNEKDGEENKLEGTVNEKKNYCYDKIVEIIVHRTDRLKLNSFVTHPVVKVHLVDVNNGKYYSKSDKSRSVVFYQENPDNDYILPVMTQCYNLQEKRSLFSAWEERILINEDFHHISSKNLIVFFELLDFPLTFPGISSVKLEKNGWHHIAFAFLKPFAQNGECNLDKKQRLQLYYYYQNKNISNSVYKCSLWDLWRHNQLKLKKYPSTLYITIKGVISPRRVFDTLRSKTPLETERPSTNDDRIEDNKHTDEVNEDYVDIKRSRMALLEDGSLLPNTVMANLKHSSHTGCFLFKFSNNGRYLACALQIDDLFVVDVYMVATLEEFKRFACHHGLIYSINWSKNDSLLITASADNTVAIWDFIGNLFMQILPHPSFVYTCDITGEIKSIIATGCFDHCVRLWKKNSPATEYELEQELEYHKGYVTSLCFNKKSNILFSADSCGVLVKWSNSNESHIWIFVSSLDLRTEVINQILLFPNENHLLVHSRDNNLRVVSMKNTCVLYCLQGSLNRRVQSYCSISPCGRFVACGSENGVALVWHVKTGRIVRTYSIFPNHSAAIHCTQFHPRNNLLAFSHYGNNVPIVLYHYVKTGNEQQSDQKDTNDVQETDINKGHVQVSKNRIISGQSDLNFREILQKIDDLLVK